MTHSRRKDPRSTPDRRPLGKNQQEVILYLAKYAAWHSAGKPILRDTARTLCVMNSLFVRNLVVVERSVWELTPLGILTAAEL